MTAMDFQQTTSYKARKEAFVSGLAGGTLTEINLVTLVAPAAILLWSALQSRQSFFAPFGPIPFVVDFLLNVCAILFAITAYSSAPLLLDILLLLPALVLMLPLQSPKNSRTSPKRSEENASSSTKPADPTQVKEDLLPNRPFITSYRGAMLIVTCLAILAVDFPIFPRRFAKAENWGTSLMDLGVGSFVFSSGVVSARALLRSRLATDAGKSPKSFLHRFAVSIRHTLPLLALGIIRLLSLKNLDYAEHVTEYGVHWNFFFTLALLPPFVEISDLITTNIPGLRYEVLALVFATVYEIVLNTTYLKAFILISPRNPTSTFLAKNREGIFSFTGYLSIFLAGRSTGLTILSPPPNSKATTKLKSTSTTTTTTTPSLLRPLLITSTVWTSLYILSTNVHLLNLTVSRRLANAPYIIWIVAFNNGQLLLFAAIEKLCFASPTISTATSKITQAFNSNGLAIFLLANLLTGLVNMTINTLDMSSLGSMGILFGYAAVLTGVAVALDGYGVKIKV